MTLCFLTALLTVIGFSVQTKLSYLIESVRILGYLKDLLFETLVNHSIGKNTPTVNQHSVMTVEFMLRRLRFFWRSDLKRICHNLLVGLLSGTYSSIFIASPILVVWEGKRVEAVVP